MRRRIVALIALVFAFAIVVQAALGMAWNAGPWWVGHIVFGTTTVPGSTTTTTTFRT